MGRNVDNIRKVLQAPARVLSIPEANDLRLKNYQNAKLIDDYAIENPRPMSAAEKVVEERLDDRNYTTGGDLAPMSVAREAIAATGDPDASTVTNNALFEAIKAEGKRTNMFRDTLTGDSPTYTYPGTIHTSKKPDFADGAMGFSEDVAVTRTTPWRMLDGLTGNRPHSDRIVGRLVDRNLPHGMGNAEIYHLDDIQEQMNRPWMVYRGQKDGFDESTSQGFADMATQSIFLNRSGDQMAAGKFQPVTRGINVGQHEGGGHGVLHHSVPSFDYILRQSGPRLRGNPLERPAIGDINRSLLTTPEAQYLSSNGLEMGNLLFHTKRLIETVQPGMRDVGATQATLDNVLEYIRNYKMTGRDPIINLEGHPNYGSPAHGLEKQIETLQQIMKAHGPDGANDFETNMNFKTSSTNPSLRTALLA